MLSKEIFSGGRLPVGLSKNRDGVMTALEDWIDDGKKDSSTHYDGCHKTHWLCMMEKAHEEIALLRLRLLRLTIAGTHADPVTHIKDPVRIMRNHIKSLQGKGKPVEDGLLLNGLESACEELIRHRSLL
jgi:hypothetical protein